MNKLTDKFIKHLKRVDIARFESFSIKIKRDPKRNELYSKFIHKEFAGFLFGLEGISYSTTFKDKTIIFKFGVTKPTLKLNFEEFECDLLDLIEGSEYIEGTESFYFMGSHRYIITLK